MENYVIRIYRRDESDPTRVIGIVEHAGDGRQQRFADMQALWTILTEQHTRHGNTVRKRAREDEPTPR